MSQWLRIDETTPADGQDVFYFFAVFAKVYAGNYRRCRDDDYPEGVWSNCFHGKSGFLTDDVTYWQPRAAGDPVPELPSADERSRDLYHSDEFIDSDNPRLPARVN